MKRHFCAKPGDSRGLDRYVSGMPKKLKPSEEATPPPAQEEISPSSAEQGFERAKSLLEKVPETELLQVRIDLQFAAIVAAKVVRNVKADAVLYKRFEKLASVNEFDMAVIERIPNLT